MGRDLIAELQASKEGRDLIAELEGLQKEKEPSAWQSVKNSFTGDDKREFDYPEIPGMVRYSSPERAETHPLGEKKDWFPAHDYLSSAGGNPLSLADLYEQKQGVKSKFDVHGNPYVDYEGEPHYLNRPGLSKMDVTQALVEFPAYTGLAAMGAKLGAVVGPVGKVAGTGAAMYGGSVGQDLISQKQGSKQPVDQEKALIIGALGAGTEVVAPLVGRIGSFLRSVWNNRRYVRNGQLTEQGRQVFADAGLDPEAFDAEFMREFSRLRSQAAPYDEAIRSAEAESLTPPVRLTKGLVTKDLEQQGREQAMLHGAPPYGREAQEVMLKGEAATNRALAENVDRVAGEVSGTGERTIASTGEGTQRATDALKEAYKTQKQGVRAAYDAAGQTNAYLPKTSTAEFVKGLRRQLINEGFDVESPKVAARLADLEKFTKNKRIKSLNLRGLEIWRKRLVKGSSDPVEDAAMKAMKHQYDAFMRDATEQALVMGDTQALKAWEKARATNTAFSRLFRDNKTIDRIVKGDLTPEETTRMLFGASKLSTASRGETLGALRSIKKALGAESKEWNALREEAVLRLLRNQPAEGFSPQKFVTSFDDAMTNGHTLMNFMFTKQELASLRKVRNVAKSAVYDKRSGNPSKTSYAVTRQLADMFGPAGRVARAFSGRLLGDTGERMQANAAIADIPYRPSAPDRAATTAAGAGSAAAIYSSQ